MCLLSKNEQFVLFFNRKRHKKLFSLEAKSFSLSQFIHTVSAGVEPESYPKIKRETLLLVLGPRVSGFWSSIMVDGCQDWLA